MKYCSKCGSQIQDNAVFCVHCGCAVSAVEKNNDEYGRLLRFSRNANAIYIISILELFFTIILVLLPFRLFVTFDKNIFSLVVLPITIILALVRRNLLKKYEDIDKNGEKYYLVPQLKPIDRCDLLMYKIAMKRFDRGIGLGPTMNWLLAIYAVASIVFFIVFSVVSAILL